MSLLHFGDFTLDARNKRLQRAGQDLAVQPKVLACIELFARHPGQLISEARLRERLWRDLSVSQEAIRRVICEVRRVLSAQRSPVTIETRRGVGYVLVAPQPSPVELEWPFVGRQRELALLESILDRNADARVCCFVHAEAGAGKSRLLAELRARTAQSLVWITGHCHASPDMPDFWPWRQVLRTLQSDPQLRRETAGFVAFESAPASGYFEVCTRFAELLQRARRVQPIVVVIEDLQWADPASMLLLELLCRADNLPCDLIVTCNLPEIAAEQPLGSAIARVLGRAGVLSVELPCLTPAELRELLCSVKPELDSPHAAQALAQWTGGNPLFVEQWLRQQASPGGAPPAASKLRHIVLARVAPLPERSRRLLEQAAVLGRAFSLPLLAAIANASEAHVRRQLQPALDLGLLQRGGTPAELSFVHELLRDVLYQALDPGLRQRQHLAVLRAAHSLSNSFERKDLLALHAYFAGAAVPAARTLRLCERAGRAAFCAQAFDAAAVHLERALSLLDASSSVAQRAELTLLWARARWQTQQSAQSVRALFLEAAKLSRAARAWELFAQAAIGYAIGEDSVLNLDSSADFRGELALLAEAWRRLPASKHALRQRVARATCWLHETSGDTANARLHAKRALRRRPPRDDVGARILSLGMRIGAGDDRAAVLAEIDTLRAAPRLGEHQRLELQLHAMAVCLVLGDAKRFSDARHELECLTAELEPQRFGRLGEALGRSVMASIAARATEAILAGDFQDAERWIAHGVQRAQRLDLGPDAMRRPETLQLPWQLCGYRARRNALMPLVEARTPHTPAALWQLALARAECALERSAMREASGQFRLLRNTQFRVPQRGLRGVSTRPVLVRIADLCVRVGTPEDAATLYARLLPAAGLCVCDGVMLSFGASDRPLGALASQLGQHARAEQHLRAALQINQRAQHRPELARTRHALARSLELQGREHEARAAFEEAKAEASAFGMVLD